MTPRHVIRVDFREIRAVEVHCKCGAIMSLPLPKTSINLHVDCMACNATLWYEEMEGGPYSKVQALMRSLSAWQQVEVRPFSLQFYLEAGDASDRAFRDKNS